MTTHAISTGSSRTLPQVAPGPKGCILMGSVPELRRDAVKLFSDAARDYGDVVRLKLVQDVHLLNHPDHVKHVLQDNHSNYVKGFMYDRMKPLVGLGLLTSEGESWLRNRRLAQPAFHRQKVAGFVDLMAKHTAVMLQRWEGQATLDVHAEMMKLTMAIVADALFSADLSGESDVVAQALTTALKIINDRFQSFFIMPDHVPTPQNRKLRQAITVLDNVVNGVIAERHRSGKQHNDLLGMLMAARDEETGEGMSDKQLRDEVMTMFLAGHETTANALAWAWYLLSLNPAVERKMLHEVTLSLEGRAPTFKDLPKLQYTSMVIEESMRLYPPAWLIARKALKPDVIGGYNIPGGSTVMLCPYTMHRHPKFWENPEGFDPERFSPEHSAGRPKFAYYPFAAGPRMCIGMSFAMMEAQVIAAMIVQKYRLHLVPGHSVYPDPNVTLRPGEGIKVDLHPQK